jgi:hypothetical protein
MLFAKIDLFVPLSIVEPEALRAIARNAPAVQRIGATHSGARP